MNSKNIVRLLLGVAVLFGAIVCAGLMVVLSPSAERQDVEAVATPVEVVQVEAMARPAIVMANGTVQAAERVSLVPEVQGRITWVADELAPGGRFEKGDVLAKIDDRDYAIAVRQEEARVGQAELELELELGRQKVAKREWELLRSESSGDEAPLALRRTQLKTVEGQLDSARSGLERAKLALERTRLRAPFDAVVIDESLDVGQVVGGSPVATLVGTSRFWVKVAVPVEQLGWLDMNGSKEARVAQELADGSTILRQGRIERLGGELDPQTRTATVIVAIDDPLQEGEAGLPLLPGAYVDVSLFGRVVDDVFDVPRSAIVSGNAVLVATEENTLGRREVTVAWGDDEVATVRGDLKTGDRVITTSIATPIEGMPVRVLQSTRTGSADTDDGDDAAEAM